MSLQTNPQLDLARQYVQNTGSHVYLTGKAGSGKTTFLHQLKQAGLKRMAVVAPTGVAAINAGGMTMHSLFQLPLGLYLPGTERASSVQSSRFRRDKIRLIQSLDLLVIDEISMVRADLLDAVDAVLKRFRDPYQPFGGLQLLMIGDLHQLPPVVKPEDWTMLREHYQTPYFFDSHALKQTHYVAIELKHIYRQSDPELIGLLNLVRENRLDEHALRALNQRYRPDFAPPVGQPHITLTATNSSAAEINRESLCRLSTKPRKFEAIIEGQFPPSSFPTEQVLELKVDAQVMFIRNDTSEARRFFNGKLGRITRIDQDMIWVRCPDETSDIPVERAEWQNIKYVLNEETKQIEERLLGSFTQFPVKLAWAITIHKSQGLTFERCIIDAEAAFAHGQVYVALSRCKSLDGIVLRSPIEPASVKTDPIVRDFSEQAERNLPSESQLLNAKSEYQSATLKELFDFGSIMQPVNRLLAIIRENAGTLVPEAATQCQALSEHVTETLLNVSRKFHPQLCQYLAEDLLPVENANLQTRIRKASVYFTEKLEGLFKDAGELPSSADNQEVASNLDKAIRALRLAVAIKLACFKACKDGFSVESLGQARVNAELDFANIESSSSRVMKIPKGISHPELYQEIYRWREQTAQQNNRSPFEVVPNLTINEIARCLPTDRTQLRNLPGIGKARAKRYGDTLVNMVRSYLKEQNVDAELTGRHSAQRPNISQTKQTSFEMFCQGKTIDEIAAQRSLAVSTIQGHLAVFIKRQELDVHSVLESGAIEDIRQYLSANPEVSLSRAKKYFRGKYDYGEIKMVMAASESAGTEAASSSTPSSRKLADKVAPEGNKN